MQLKSNNFFLKNIFYLFFLSFFALGLSIFKDYGFSIDLSIGLTRYKMKENKTTYPFGVNINTPYINSTNYDDWGMSDISCWEYGNCNNSNYYEINLESEKMHYPIIAVFTIAEAFHLLYSFLKVFNFSSLPISLVIPNTLSPALSPKSTNLTDAVFCFLIS